MKTKTTLIISFALALLVLAVGLFVQPQLPDPMAVHWGMSGEPNGYDSYFVGIWLLPLMMMGITLILVGVPYIDPRKENYKKFMGIYHVFILGFNVYMAVIQGMVLAWNLGLEFDMGAASLPLIGLFEILIGLVIQKAKSNYFVGIRTPWTLQDERVWDDTHRFSGKLFIGGGIVTLLGLLFPKISFWLLMIPILSVVFIAIGYSYFSYQKFNPKQK